MAAFTQVPLTDMEARLFQDGVYYASPIVWFPCDIYDMRGLQVLWFKLIKLQKLAPDKAFFEKPHMF